MSFFVRWRSAVRYQQARDLAQVDGEWLYVYCDSGRVFKVTEQRAMRLMGLGLAAERNNDALGDPGYRPGLRPVAFSFCEDHERMYHESRARRAREAGLRALQALDAAT